MQYFRLLLSRLWLVIRPPKNADLLIGQAQHYYETTQKNLAFIFTTDDAKYWEDKLATTGLTGVDEMNQELPKYLTKTVLDDVRRFYHTQALAAACLSQDEWYRYTSALNKYNDDLHTATREYYIGFVEKIENVLRKRAGDDPAFAHKLIELGLAAYRTEHTPKVTDELPN